MYESLLGNYDKADFYEQRKKYMLQRVDEAASGRANAKVNAKIGAAGEELQGSTDADTLRDDRVKKGQAVSLKLNETGTDTTVTDSLLASLDAIAKTDILKNPYKTAGLVTSNGYALSGDENRSQEQQSADWANSSGSMLYDQANSDRGNTTALTNLQSLLGRVDGVATSISDYGGFTGALTHADEYSGNRWYTQSVKAEPTIKADNPLYSYYQANGMPTENVITTTGHTASFGLTEAEKTRLKGMDARTLLDRFFETDTSKY